MSFTICNQLTLCIYCCTYQKVKIERHERVGQDGGVSYSSHLEVVPSGGEEEVEWFDNLEKSELEWMVTSIKDRLGLASD